MITDCSTFLIEYLMTGKPLINLVSKNAVDFNTVVKEALKYFYKPKNREELEEVLNSIISLIPNSDWVNWEIKILLSVSTK